LAGAWLVVLIVRRLADRRPNGEMPLGLGRSSADPWGDASALAARGQYLEAAHALFAGVLQSLQQRGEARPHPSKTIGEYSRELRTTDGDRRGTVRAFLRLYELILFGMQGCDAARYAELHALAVSAAGRHEAAA
jgi:hypothetical protein